MLLGCPEVVLAPFGGLTGGVVQFAPVSDPCPGPHNRSPSSSPETSLRFFAEATGTGPSMWATAMSSTWPPQVSGQCGGGGAPWGNVFILGLLWFRGCRLSQVYPGLSWLSTLPCSQTLGPQLSHINYLCVHVYLMLATHAPTFIPLLSTCGPTLILY